MMSTPIEQYKHIFVKREDLVCIDETNAPPFSKIRGLMSHLIKAKQHGVKAMGYTETSISMAGWGVAWACKQLNMKAVIFDPQYKITPKILKYHRTQWKKFNPDIIPIKAGMAAVNFYISRKILKEKYGDKALMLPLGIPLKESIIASATEYKNTIPWLESDQKIKFKSVIVAIGSGTIAAGVYSEITPKCTMYGIMTRSGSIKHKRESILNKSGFVNGRHYFDKGLLGINNLQIIDPGWKYTDYSYAPCPFPCHKYYDRKAWQWLKENIKHINTPILFWNIGH